MNDISTVRLFRRAVGFRGVFRPGDVYVPYPVISIPLQFSNAGSGGTPVSLQGQTTLSSASITPTFGPTAQWANDPNLLTYMPQTGRFFVIADHYQFRVDNSATVSAAEQSGIINAFRDAYFVHAPKVGAKPYYYRAQNGLKVEPGVLAIGADAAAAMPYAGYQYANTQPTPFGFPLLLDFANDSMTIQYPASAGAPATWRGWIDFHGFAISYDQNPDLERTIRNRSRGLLGLRAAAKAAPALRGLQELVQAPRKVRQMLDGDDHDDNDGVD